MNRFRNNKPAGVGITSWLLSLLIFVGLAAGLWIGSSRLAEQTREEQRQMIEDAVRRAAVQCYALEGSYPTTLEYLAQRYGLQVDQQQYIIHYQPTAGNLPPQIHVLYRDGKGGE